MITKLTKEQEEKLPGYVKTYTARGLATCDGNLNKPEIEKAVAAAYKEGGIQPPSKFVYAKNPKEGAKVAAKLTGQKVSEIWRSGGYGSHEVSWLSFYAVMRDIGVREADRLLPLDKLSELIGWWWPLSETAVITPRPSHISLDNQGRLHNENGAALKYSGEDFLYSIRGIRIPLEYKGFVLTPADKLDARDVLAIEDVNIRALICQKMGLERIYEHCDARTIEETNITDLSGTAHPYSLVSLLVPGTQERVTALRMKNPSTGDIHVEGVPGECDTVRKALFWRVSGVILESDADYIPPIRLT